MAQMFRDEKTYQDNAPRKNFVFLAYPYTPLSPWTTIGLLRLKLSKNCRCAYGFSSTS